MDLQEIKNRLKDFKLYYPFVSKNEMMKKVARAILTCVRVDINVLIIGETGTGKDMVAQTIHRLSGKPADKFIRVNCGAIPEGLAESELLGHTRGAFTGASESRRGKLELADGGTLFLDEIASMRLSMQAILLNALDGNAIYKVGGEKEFVFRMRVLAASNGNLEEAIKDRLFREDLYYRLAGIIIELPPLRERVEDIKGIAEYVLRHICQDASLSQAKFDAEALGFLQDRHWSGNIREMKNTIERVALLTEKQLITAKDLEAYNRSPLKRVIKKGLLQDSEYEMIIEALNDNHWIQKAAAQQLGISARAMNYKIWKYGITHERWRRK